MPHPSKSSLTYLKFLNLVQAVRALPSFPAMDAVEERLLNMLAAAWQTGRQITVLEAMDLSHEISPATIHRRLKTLREKGLIALDTDRIDSRVKYVVPTPLANKYFSKLSECLAKASVA